MFELVLLNTMEFVAIALFFAYIGRTTEFLIAAGVLLSVRTFSGGFHLKKFRYCFVLTFAIFVAVILVLPDVSNTFALMETLLLVSILLTVALAPVSKRKSAAKNNLIFKVISTAVILVYSFWLLTARDNPYASIVTWTILFQSVQLIIGKVMILHEKAKKQQHVS